MASETPGPSGFGTSLPGSSYGLRVRLQKQSSLKLPPKSAAQRSKEYRASLRARMTDEEHAAFRADENRRVKEYILCCGGSSAKIVPHPEKKDQYRRTNTLRQRRRRERLRAEGKSTSSVKTRKEKQKQQAIWRKQKQNQRANESESMRAARNQRRREAYKKKKDQSSSASASKSSKRLKHLVASGLDEVPDFPPINEKPETIRKRVYRTKKSLPSLHGAKVGVIEHLVKNATPRTKKMLENRGICTSESPDCRKELFGETEIATSLKTSKLRRAKTETDKRRVLLGVKGLSVLKKYSVRQARSCGVGYKMLKKIKSADSWSDLAARKSRKDKVSEELKDMVQAWYKQPERSRTLPDARGVKRGRDGQLIPRSFMEQSYRQAYTQFKEVNPDVNIGLAAFCSLKPENILPSTSSRRRDCLCDFCLNIDLKIEAVRMTSTRKQLGILMPDRWGLSRLTLCSKGDTGEYRGRCLDPLRSKCTECGVNGVDPLLQPLLGCGTDITYQHWERVEEGGKSRLTRVKKQVSPAAFIDELKTELKKFSSHLFNASWQGRKYTEVSAQPPEKTVIICQDFAENYANRFQDEGQTVHWNPNTTTVHSSYCSYTCDHEGCDQIMSESCIFITPDPDHCSNAVSCYNDILMKHLQPLSFKRAIFFSDGAPGQYKNKNSFVHMSFLETDHAVKGERHFFGSRHGKGPCDREFGSLKRALKLQVNARTDMDSALEVFQVLDEKYTRVSNPGPGHTHFRRKFFYVKPEEVQRYHARLKDLKPLDKTKKQHCVVPLGPYTFRYRERSCFCDSCRDEGLCQYIDVTGEWQTQRLLKKKDQRNQMFPMPAVPHPPVTVPAPSATPNTDHAATTDPALNTEAASNPAAIPSANPEPNAAPDLSTAPAQADKNSASSPSTSDATARDLQPLASNRPELNAAPDLSTAPAQADNNSASSPSTSDATARDLQPLAFNRPELNAASDLSTAPALVDMDLAPSSPFIDAQAPFEPLAAFDLIAVSDSYACPGLEHIDDAPSSPSSEARGFEAMQDSVGEVAAEMKKGENQTPVSYLPSFSDAPFLKPTSPVTHLPASPSQKCIHIDLDASFVEPSSADCSISEADTSFPALAVPSSSTSSLKDDHQGIPENQLLPGNWVKVKLQNKKSVKFFNASILQRHTTLAEIEVSFLVDKGTYQHFPNTPDISWVPLTDVTPVTPPKMNSRGHYFF